ncbi:MAG: hypothetical protein IT463_00255 [Planctomycetes bacterium]|nr:hypothetical protein [Planctomycetota bacterium]
MKPFWMRWRGVLLAASALVATPTAFLTGLNPVEVHAQASFDDAKKAYEQGKKSESRTAMERAVEDIGASGTPEAAKFLLGELASDQKDRKKGKKGLPGEVRKKIILALSKFKDEASVKLIGQGALDLNSAPKGGDPTLALDQFDFFLALSNMEGVAAADDAVKAAIADNDNPYVKVAALEAVRQAGAARFVDAACGVLREENDAWAKEWRIVPINALACLQDIVEPEQTDKVIQVVEAVMAWEQRALDKKLPSDERVRFFGGRMLTKLTGETADMASIPYWKWWVAQMKAVGKVDRSQKSPEKASKTAPPKPVFDAAPVGKRFVFVIDISKSMELPLKINLDDIEKRRKARTTKGPGEKGDAEPAEDDNPLRKLPWDKIDTKMALAREELARSIENFEGDREFAIITYSREVECVTGGWVKATKDACGKWGREARKLEPDSLTNIHGGLMMSLRLSAKGTSATNPCVDPDCVLTGADTIVFLTDGWASWSDDSVSQTVDDPRGGGGKVGDGQFILGDVIVTDILRQNMFRKVVINTVGIGNHDENAMKGLAKGTGGTYVDWGFKES